MQHTLILFSTLLIAVSASAQPISRDLRILFNADGYLQTAYSGPTVPGTLIFFDDEPLRLLVRFVNWSDETLTLRTGGASVGDVVSVRLYRRSESGPAEVAVRLGVNGEPLINGASRESVLRWEQTIPIPAKGYVTIPMLVQTDRLEPGTYEVRLNQLRVSCAPDCRVLNHAGQLDFNISRADDLPKQLDSLLRRAYEAISRGTLEDADSVLKRVLELYPQASVAYQLLAQRAERAEQWKEAAAAYERAAELVETKADRLRPPAQGLAGTLRHMAAEARRRQDKR